MATDYFVYGIVIPLTPFSPAGIATDEQLTILEGAYAVGTLVMTPLFGYLGDRFGCRRIILGGALMLGLATALLAWAPTFTFMIAARVVQGASAAATWTVGLAIIAENYSGDRVRMMNIALMGSTAGSVVGPTLAGVLYKIGGYRLPFFAAVAVIAIDLLALIAVVPADEHNQAPDANVFTLLKDRTVLVSGIAVMLAAAAWAIVESLVPNHAARGGADPGQIGLMFTLTTVIYGLSAPLVIWIVGRIGMRRTAVLGATVLALSIPLLGVSTNIYAIGAVISVVQIAFAILINPQSAEMGDAVEARGLHSYCAVYSVYNITYTLGTIGMALLASAILPYFRLEIVLVCLGGVLLLFIPALLAVRAPDETRDNASELNVG
jgi:MFS transporter, DHA1 family, solute carrier family 18 (vesicular amine transporter), member 1/2